MSTSPERPPGRAPVRVALLVLATACFCWNALWFTPFVVDDAFISMRYARHLVEGLGPVFNPGERVEGFSNPLWVLIEAGLLATGAPLVAGVQALGLAAGAALLWVAHALGRRVSPHGVAPALACGLLATSSSLALWSVAGLETSLFALLLLAAVLRFEVERGRGRPGAPSAGLYALAWVSRPEAPLYLAYFLLRRPGRRWLGLLAALVAPYELAGLGYYGRLFPATHAAKVGAGLPLRLDGLAGFVTEQGPWLPLLLGAGALGCALGRRTLARAAWVPAACGLGFLLVAGTDWMPRYRFFVPVLPFLYLCAGHGLGELLRRARPGAARAALGAGFALVVLGCVHQQLLGAYTRGGKGFGEVGAARRASWPVEVPARLGRRVWPQEGIALAILQQVPEGETVAIGDIGFPGFLTGDPVFDLRGLVTPAMARWRHEAGAASDAAMLAALRSADPALILIPSLGRDRDQPMGRLVGVLEGQDWLRAGWVRREDRAARTIVYLRRDLEAPDRRAARRRLRAAFERLPEYDSDPARQLARALGL